MGDRAMTRLWVLWPPFRRRQEALDAWCADRSDALAIIAGRVAQLGITIPTNEDPVPSDEFYQHVIRQEQERAYREGARVRKDWAIASLGAAVFGFCVGLIVMGWHP